MIETLIRRAESYSQWRNWPRIIYDINIDTEGYTFQLPSMGNGTYYTVDWGDGIIQSVPNNTQVQHKTYTPGNYQITVFNQKATSIGSWLSVNSKPKIYQARFEGIHSTLKSLDLSNGKITSIDLSPVPNLTSLTLSSTQITSIDLSPVPNLTSLTMTDTPLKEPLNLSVVPNLTTINVYRSWYVNNELDISQCSKLKNVSVCQGNNLGKAAKIKTFFRLTNGALDPTSVGSFLNRTTRVGTGYYGGPGIAGSLYTEDGQEITATHVIRMYANKVQEESLFDYPMGICSSNQILTKDQTRDMYDDILILGYKSVLRDMNVYYTYPYAPLQKMTTPQQTVGLSGSPTVVNATKILITCNKDADFFICTTPTYAYSIDGRHRFLYNNGNIEYKGVTVQVQEETEESVTYVISNWGITSNNAGNASISLLLYENVYSNDIDQYTSKIESFTKITE